MVARPKSPQPRMCRVTLRLTAEQREALFGLAKVRNAIRAVEAPGEPEITASSLLRPALEGIVEEYHRLRGVFNDHDSDVGKARRARRAKAPASLAA